jgi:peptidylprolyl isomerase
MRIDMLSGVFALALAANTAADAKGPQDEPKTWRPLDAENAILIESSKGPIIVELYPEIAPDSVARVKELAREHFYDGLTFHRVIDGFMAQGGDPKGDGSGGSDKPDVKAELTMRRGKDFEFRQAAEPAGSLIGFHKAMPLQSQPDGVMALTADKKVSAWPVFCQGVMAMARSDSPDSANSQFFLMRAAYPSLEKRYTAVGRVVWGQENVNAFAVGEPPNNPDMMKSVRVVADLEGAAKPDLYVMRVDSDEFKDRLRDERKEKKADFSVCDVKVKTRMAE